MERLLLRFPREAGTRCESLMTPTPGPLSSLYRAASREQLDAQNDQSKNQHDVDVGAQGVEADPTEQPEY